MPKSKKQSPLRKWGTHIIAMILGVFLGFNLLQGLSLSAPEPNPLASTHNLAPATVSPATVSRNPSSSLQAQAIAATIPTPTNGAHSFVAQAVNQVGPAVVRIDIERVVETNARDFPMFNDPFFRRFFGNDLMPQFPQEYREQGQGSGFIVDGEGIVLTNAHVVSQADTVTVNLRDGRSFQGEVLGVDELSDLAVVKIDGHNLPVAALGNSGDLQVGDWAIAVGNPLGLDNTVTLGIISTLNRSSSSVGIPDKRLDFIQTDAAINPGNSGGPLLNAQGEVIGINTAIRADAEGIGFAIPIDQARQITDRLALGETIPHPYVGIRMVTLTPELAQEYNSDPNGLLIFPEIDGVLVVQVMPSSPASQAGLRRGDVITEIEGTAVTTADQLQQIVEKSTIGQPLRFNLERNGQSQQLSVRPGDIKDFS
jgi:S1-C subfamily serine protease